MSHVKSDRKKQSFEPPEKPGPVRAQLQKTTAIPRWVQLREPPNRLRGPGDGELPFLMLPPRHGELLFLLCKSCPVEGKEGEDGRRPRTFWSLFLLLCQQTIASPLICESPQAPFMPLPYRFPSPSHLRCYLRLSEPSEYCSVRPARREAERRQSCHSSQVPKLSSLTW